MVNCLPYTVNNITSLITFVYNFANLFETESNTYSGDLRPTTHIKHARSSIVCGLINTIFNQIGTSLSLYENSVN